MPPNPQLTTGWHVTAQEDTMGLDPSNRAVAGIQVHFQTTRGVTSSIFVPKSSYSVENVKAMILEAVAHLHAVQDLKG